MLPAWPHVIRANRCQFCARWTRFSLVACDQPRILQSVESVSATYADLTPFDIENTTCSCVKDDYCLPELHVVDSKSLQAVKSVYSQYLLMISNQRINLFTVPIHNLI